MHSEWLRHDSALRLQLGTRAGSYMEAFIVGVALSKKILDFGLRKIDHLSPFADSACVPRCRDQREESS